MPKKIILIRHGQTEHNLSGLAQGWLDTKLNRSGAKQAKKVAERLKNEVVDYIYTSDLKRAADTANNIAKKGYFSVKTDKRLRELNMGDWADKQWAVIHEKFKHILGEQKEIIDHDWKEHGGESINELKQRLVGFIDHLKMNHLDQTITIVTHGGTKRTILKILNLISQHERPSFNNTGVTIIEKDKNGSYKLKLFNDTSHLEE